MSEFGEFGGLPTAPDPALSPSFEAPASPRRSVDWAKILPALGLVAGALHGHRARRKLMDLTGEHVSRRKVLDEALYGATLGWVPQVLKDAKDGMSGQSKTAGVGTGAAIGNTLLGPVGAGIGAHMEKDPDHKYYGSPALRAAGGSSLGTVLGLLAGIGISKLRTPRYLRWPDHAFTPGNALITALLTAGGSTAGSVLGAKSVNSRPFNDELRKTAGVGTGAVLGNLGFGPLGAGLGAEISKDDQYRYHGSPGVRAAVGSVGGGLGGLGTGILLGALLANRRRSEVLHPTTGILSALLAGGGSTYGAYAGAKSVDRSHRSEMPKHAAFRPFASKKSVGSAALRGAGVGAGVGGALGATPGAIGMATDRSSFGRAVSSVVAMLGGGVGAAAGAPIGAATNALRAGVHNAKIDRDRATLSKNLLLASGAVALGAGGAKLVGNKEKKASAGLLSTLKKRNVSDAVLRSAAVGGLTGSGLGALAGGALGRSAGRSISQSEVPAILKTIHAIDVDALPAAERAAVMQDIGDLGATEGMRHGGLAGAQIGGALGAVAGGITGAVRAHSHNARRGVILRNTAAGAAGLAGATGLGLALANRNKDKK